MKQVVFTILITTIILCTSQAQYNPPEVIKAQDTIFVELDIDKGLSYSHTIKPKQTMYSIAKYFGLNINALYAYNGMSNMDIINPGQTIIIPLENQMINKHSNMGVPMVYKVKAKETLYRISKVYFDQDVEQLVKRNTLSGFNLDVGQNLIVGYYDLNQSNEESKELEIISLDAETNEAIPEFTELTEEELTGDDLVRKRYSEKSIAIWDRNASDKQSAFVLHKTAKPGSYIEIHNPVVNRKTVAQVVGNLPEGLYPADVDMVMSPLVAKSLGALDTRIMVELTYEY